MKIRIMGIALFLLTAASVIGYPLYMERTDNSDGGGGQPPLTGMPADNAARIEVVFVLDTTGSMGGLIQAAKEKIWSIASTFSSAQPAPEIRMGLVAYRDRGDAYVTRVVDLSTDLDSMFATLMDFEAAGGGDGPESVNQALFDAVHNISWSREQEIYRVIFLVGDAPPHMDYQDDVRYPVTLRRAKEMGIIVNTIQCGGDGSTTPIWQQIAQLNGGSYFQVEQGGSAVAIATPFDEQLAALSRKLDVTRLYYGNRLEKEQQEKKRVATEKLHDYASVASRARRAEFNVSASGKSNMLGEKELVDDVVNGRLDLSGLDKSLLPEPMQALNLEQQQAVIEQKAEQRRQLQQQIRNLGEQRGAFLKRKVEEAGGMADSLDAKLFGAVREQAAAKGLVYESEAPAY